MGNHSLLMILVVFLACFLIACSSTTEGKSGRKAVNNGSTPIHSNPKRCSRPHYDLPSEDRRCYALHEKLSIAAGRGDTVDMQEALDAGAQIDGTAGDLFNPLMTAALTGKLQAVKFLLDRGANIDFQGGSFRQSALSSAAAEGQVDVVLELVERGANVCIAQVAGPPTFPIESAANDEIRKILADAGGANCK